MHKYTEKYIKKYNNKYNKMKIIKLDEEVHQRLVKDKEEFTETIGFRFTLSDTVREYQKIINIHKDAAETIPPCKAVPDYSSKSPK